MSERCHGCKQRPSKGSIGMLRYCYECIASLTGESKKIVRSRRVDVRLTHGRMTLGYSEWVPDHIAALYKSKVSR